MIKLKLVLPVKCPLWYLKKRNINWFRGKPIRNCEGSEFLFLLQANNLACYCFTQGGWGQRLLGQRQRTLLPVAQQAGWFSYLNSLALFLKPHGSKSRCRPRWMLHPQGICAIGKENERRKHWFLRGLLANPHNFPWGDITLIILIRKQICPLPQRQYYYRRLLITNSYKTCKNVMKNCP